MRPAQYGIKNVVEFASGALLVTLEKEKAQPFKTRLKEVGLQVKDTNSSPREYRFAIHNVPIDNTIEEIKDDVEHALGNAANTVTLVLYKEEQKNHQRIAVVTCGKELFDLAETRISILVGYQRCPIDTRPRLMRCQTCHLYGHTKNHCSGIPESVTKEAEGNRHCADCLVYNRRQKLAKRPKTFHRNTDHPAGSSSCGTKRALLKKYLASRGSTRNTGEAEDSGK